MSRMRHRTAWGSLAFASCLLAVAATAAAGQLVRGTVRAGNTLMPIDRATISAIDAAGAVLGTAITDPLGSYEMGIRTDGGFTLRVRRLGYSVASADVKALAATDTVDFEFLLNEVAAAAEAVTVVAEPGLNDRRLSEATRRGWKVYEPELVMVHRDRAQDFHHLMRSLGNPGLVFPRSINDCIRSTRFNRCLTYVVDNQVMGNSALIEPRDIYFVAILSASESRTQFGDRAPFGAIAVYTRSRLDRVQPPAPPSRRKAPPKPAPARTP